MAKEIASEFAYVTALEMARSIRLGEYSSVEVTEALLRRIEAVNPQLNAYLTVAAETAVANARDADRMRAQGGELPPFLGVPISIKDLADTAGIRTTCGTRAWADRVPSIDDEVVSRIRRAGFIILGKTTTPEFGRSVVSEPLGYPPARNPWNIALTPGGSSGGAGAAVAAGLGPVAHGSDTGGSVRIPSALCGVVGMRPSRGRISQAPNAASLHTTNGPLARSVSDCAALLDVMAGPALGDDFFAAPPPRAFLEEVVAPGQPLRIAFSSRPFMPDVEASPEHLAALHDTARQLEALGHQVEENAPPWDDSIAEATLAMFAAEAAAGADDSPAVELLDDSSQTLINMGRTVSAVEYLKVLEHVRRNALGVHRFFQEWDVLLTPTVPGAPLPVGSFGSSGDTAGVDTLMSFRALMAFTTLCTYTGVPGISLPLAIDSAGLPVGMQFMARMNGEDTLFALAAQLEEAMPWSSRQPPTTHY